MVLNNVIAKSSVGYRTSSISSSNQIPRVYFVCKICSETIETLELFMSHKRKDHSEEFKEIKVIIFEERFFKTEDDFNWDEMTFPSSPDPNFFNEDYFENSQSSIRTEINDALDISSEENLRTGGEKTDTTISTPKNVLGNCFDPEQKSNERDASPGNHLIPYYPCILLKRLSTKQLEATYNTQGNKFVVNNTLGNCFSNERNATLRGAYPRSPEYPNPYILLKRLSIKQLRAAYNTQVNEPTLPSKRCKIVHNLKQNTKHTPSYTPTDNAVIPTVTFEAVPYQSVHDAQVEELEDSEFIVASIVKSSDGSDKVQFVSTSTSVAVPEPDMEFMIEADEECMQKLGHQVGYSVGTRPNVIHFSKDPKSKAFSGISKANRVTCKLCKTIIVTEAEFKNHSENCYLHNKDRHIHCIRCNKNFKYPKQLTCHLLSVHSTCENLPERNKTNDFGKLPSRGEVKDKNEGDSGSGENNHAKGEDKDLSLAEWLANRQKHFPDLILLDPDLTQFEFRVALSFVKQGIQCLLCSERLKSEADIKHHVAACWPYNKINHRSCPVCKTRGWKFEILLEHRRTTHSGKTGPLPPFFCIECKLEFGTQEELDLHEHSLQEFLQNMWTKANLTRPQALLRLPSKPYKTKQLVQITNKFN